MAAAPGGGSPAIQLAALFVAIGCLLRVWNLLGGRSLWLDEAMVADSIVHRDWAGLLRPLSNEQVAPTGWLFIERAAFELFGGSDLALRLPQLIAGIAGLVLFAVVARRLFAAPGFVLAVAFFAISPDLVRYSADVKPYSFDVLASVAAVALSVRYLLHSAPLRARDHIGLLAFGVAVVLVSFPAAFVLAGLGGALFLREALARRWASALSLSAVSLLWLGAFAWVLLRVQVGSDSNVGAMTASWEGAFAPLPPTSVDDVKWYVKSVLQVFRYMFEAEGLAASVLGIAIGLVVTFRNRTYLGIALAAPFAIALLASGFHVYPFSERLLLFALPQMTVLAYTGVDAAVAAFRSPIAASVGAGLLLLFGPVRVTWGEFTYYPAPFGTEHLRPVLEQIAERAEGVEAIYVNSSGLPAFRYYQDAVGLADIAVIEGRPLRGSVGCLLADVELVAQKRRVWVLHSHSSLVLEGASEDVAFRYFADAIGRRVYGADLISVHAYLYEFGEGGAQRLAAIRAALGTGGECRESP